jgi:hypothetical protein
MDGTGLPAALSVVESVTVVCLVEDAEVVGVESDVGSVLVMCEIESGVETGELVVLWIEEGVKLAKADDNVVLIVDSDTGLAECATDEDAETVVWRT